jgi:CheY-like chemotaxis protein
MPGLNGESVLAQISGEPDLRGLPIIILTSVGEKADARKFECLGCTAYLTKPIRQRQLLQALGAALGTVQRDEEGGDSREEIVPRRSEDEDGPGGPRVLLAEDNVVNQRVALKILEKGGCRVDVAANGAEAVKAAEQGAYDIIFMDVQMPEMDGFEATRALRRQGALNQNTPVIAMTAHAMKGDRERCLAEGMDDYVAKPVKRDTLLGMVKQWRHRSSAAEVPFENGPE